MLAWPGYVLVFLGAGLGGAARHAVNVVAARLPASAAFAATVAVNVVGSFVIGLLAAYLAAGGLREPLRLLVATGVLGGFTTFSAFSLDAATLWQRGEPVAAAAYVLLSVGLSLSAVLVGLSLGPRLLA